MTNIPCFDAVHLEAACKILGDTTRGLTGDGIGYILSEMEVPDTDIASTKWKRLFNALANIQNTQQIGNHLMMFINRAMKPARYVRAPELFEWRRNELNVVLAFAGFYVREDGRVGHTTPETTLAGARARAGQLHLLLESRGTHSEVLKYCRAELIEKNYFHAVFEAVKGVAERIRQLSGLTTDGAELVNQALSVKSPILLLNPLKSETEQSEQKGIANLLLGIFGAIRNPTAHAPKIIWTMPEQDAIDIFSLLSFVHRKLDKATRN